MLRKLKTDIFEQWTLAHIGQGHQWFEIMEWFETYGIHKDDRDVNINGFYFKHTKDAMMFTLRWG